MTSVKELAKETIDAMPDDVGWDDVIYRLYVRKKIEAGLKDVAEGRTHSIAEVRRRFRLSEAQIESSE